MKNFKPKKVLLPYFSIFFCATTLYAQSVNQVSDPKNKISISFSTGFQIQNFNWSIAGNKAGQNPNILSELKWKNLKGVNLGLGVDYTINPKLTLHADYQRTQIFAGKVSDIDYQADNRSQETYNSLFDSDKGSTDLISASVDYKILVRRRFKLALSAGYIYSTQRYFLLDHRGIYNADLNSTYTSIWQGIKTGVSGNFLLAHRLTADASFTYSVLNYHANGNWNLISDFEHPVSYKHSASGFGLDPAIRFNYFLSQRWMVFITGKNSIWQVRNGTDELYLTNDEKPQTRLNGVNFNSNYIGFGIRIYP